MKRDYTTWKLITTCSLSLACIGAGWPGCQQEQGEGSSSPPARGSAFQLGKSQIWRHPRPLAQQRCERSERCLEAVQTLPSIAASDARREMILRVFADGKAFFTFTPRTAVLFCVCNCRCHFCAASSFVPRFRRKCVCVNALRKVLKRVKKTRAVIRVVWFMLCGWYDYLLERIESLIVLSHMWRTPFRIVYEVSEIAIFVI